MSWQYGQSYVWGAYEFAHYQEQENLARDAGRATSRQEMLKVEERGRRGMEGKNASKFDQLP